MRRWVSFAVIVGLFLVIPHPANAIHKGRVCREFRGPDGDIVHEHLDACLVVNDNDFQDQIQALVVYTNPGDESVTIHVSYLRLIRGSTTVRDTGSFVYTLGDHSARAFGTTWLNNPSGTYHSRLRMWVCWPERAGDPCGSVVVWNSGDVTY